MPRFVYQNQEIRHYDQVMRGTAVVLTNKNGVKLEKKKIVPQEGGIYSDVMGQLVDDDININEYFEIESALSISILSINLTSSSSSLILLVGFTKDKFVLYVGRLLKTISVQI